MLSCHDALMGHASFTMSIRCGLIVASDKHRTASVGVVDGDEAWHSAAIAIVTQRFGETVR